LNSRIPEDKVSFQHSFKVKLKDIDALNHVNNVVYLQWVQEVSYMHWDVLASTEIKDTYVWMTLRHEIDYLSQAYVNDTITVYTWIDETRGVKSTRIVHIYCEDKLLTKSKTIFCLLSKETLKPKRIGEDILELFTK
jgi:acyl-CoA thioester hydrolase